MDAHTGPARSGRDMSDLPEDMESDEEQSGGSGVLDVDEVFGTQRSPDEKDIRKRLNFIASADLRELYDAKGKILLMDQWPEHVVLAIESWKYHEGSKRWEFKLNDKIRALDALAKLDGLFNKEKEEDPMTKLFSRIPREVLQEIVAYLMEMAEEAQAATDKKAKEEEDAFDIPPVRTPKPVSKEGDEPNGD